MKNNSIFLSTVIPTIGRSSLSRAVESVLNQQFSAAEFEVIVVNDSGRPLPPADWQNSPCVTIIDTNQHNRSVGRNAGAAVSRGQYLHFLDDDDWLLPGALNHFWSLTNDSMADWLYGGFRLVDDNGEKLADILPEATGNTLIQMLSFEWIPLQASIIKSTAFFDAGGFASLESLLGGFEDIDLSRQITLRGNMSATSEVVAVIRVGNASSTTNYNDMFLQNRQSREKLLDAPGVFQRLCASISEQNKQRDYWFGRLVYYYLASMKWNLMRKRFFKSISRGGYLVAGFLVAGKYIFSRNYWPALTRPHYNLVWQSLNQSGTTQIYDGVEWK